jgi:hypothetical protein
LLLLEGEPGGFYPFFRFGSQSALHNRACRSPVFIRELTFAQREPTAPGQEPRFEERLLVSGKRTSVCEPRGLECSVGWRRILIPSASHPSTHGQLVSMSDRAVIGLALEPGGSTSGRLAPRVSSAERGDPGGRSRWLRVAPWATPASRGNSRKHRSSKSEIVSAQIPASTPATCAARPGALAGSQSNGLGDGLG